MPLKTVKTANHREKTLNSFGMKCVLASAALALTACQTMDVGSAVGAATNLGKAASMTDEEVIGMANDNPYGLGASIWSNDLGAVHRMIPRIKSGSVWVNCHSALDPALPFGGYKMSGVGREMGAAAIEHYTELKSVLIKL